MRKTILLLSTLFSTSLLAQFNANVSEITPDIKERMVRGNSWREGCPVSLDNLRYLQMTHLGFDGQVHLGEMIVHKEVADETLFIFEELYNQHYPIHKMQLVSNYKGNDWQSIEHDNTSAFNCRPVTGKKKKWSKHAYGKAIDINPIANPYISKTGYISHKASNQYRNRNSYRSKSLKDVAMFLKNNDKVVHIFKSYGWRWGGDWNHIKDYQHFVK